MGSDTVSDPQDPGTELFAQKKNLRTSSTVRDVLTVLVIVPNVFGALISRAGGLKLGVFVRLNASARNSKCRSPPALKRFDTAASRFL